MSRIGNKVIVMPEGVTATVNGNNIVVKGQKGELSYNFDKDMKVVVEGQEIKVSRPDDTQEHRALHGTTRANIHNMVVGVHDGYEKVLEIVGVGYRASVQGNALVLNAGYSNPVKLEITEGLTVTCKTPTEIHISGCDKQAVGEFAAVARKVRKPEPYLGKGIHYQGEHIRRKEGKKAK